MVLVVQLAAALSVGLIAGRAPRWWRAGFAEVREVAAIGALRAVAAAQRRYRRQSPAECYGDLDALRSAGFAIPEIDRAREHGYDVRVGSAPPLEALACIEALAAAEERYRAQRQVYGSFEDLRRAGDVSAETSEIDVRPLRGLHGPGWVAPVGKWLGDEGGRLYWIPVNENAAW